MSTTSGRGAAARPGRRPPVDRLADDLEVVLAVDQQPEPGPHHRLVVGEHDPTVIVMTPPTRRARSAAAGRAAGGHHRRRAGGSGAPPSTCTRSRMPTRPWPPRGPRSSDAACARDRCPTVELDRRRGVTSTRTATAGARRVTQGVGEPLLHDPVRRHVHGLRDLAPSVPLHLERRRRCRCREPARPAPRAGQRRQRRQRGATRPRGPGRRSGAARRRPGDRAVSAPRSVSSSTEPVLPSRRRTTPTWRVITLTVCATASCSSREIRVRSAATATSACFSRSWRSSSARAASSAERLLLAAQEDADDPGRARGSGRRRGTPRGDSPAATMVAGGTTARIA